MKPRSLLSIDWLLMTPVFILTIISLTTLFSLNSQFFFSQLFTLSVGLVAFIVFSFIRFETLRVLSLPIYIVSILLLILVLLIGDESRGSVRWVYIFGFPLQFSEILKPFLSVSLASFLAINSNNSLRSYFLTLILLVPIFLLIALQPDLGNALIYAGAVGLVLLVYGYPLKWFLLSFVPFVMASPFLWHFLHDYQKNRLLTFVNPTSDPLGTSYNVIQAMIAVGSGMFLGKGLSQGTQSGLRFLPERQTDFIFASLSESMGFIGSFIIIACFLFLLYRIYRIFQNAEEQFIKLFAVCVFAFILVHFFINVGMNIGLLPIVGVTLPFVSYGGSSLLSNFILLGILSAMSSSRKRENVLEIR